ncbi:MAG TPA: undecaprenyl/decaprenyl-phosphate alpha-N-acetylglucosaminyl 1-phosphate transferase [Planctomycetaceae bacterium]|jgi:UDP-GlcNAc:undecaprenyl-phosphate GlcNAc-1-phosphate transferase|nr:undecaprenyl/decaprenyl-phosphate alpha-N-acetylglucosaminyl 1-phosphate transferase [Planctomycetaceae bacterium]
MGIWLCLGVVGAFLLAVLLTPLVRRMAPALGLIDLPGHRKVHIIPTPRGGGIAIFLGVLLPAMVILCTSDLPRSDGLGVQLLAIGVGAVVLFLTGLADDRWSLSWKLRLGLQLLVACGVAGSGVRATVFVSQPWFGFGLTVLWILVLTNALNFLDNMDGLSAGIGLIASLVFATILLLMVERAAWEVALLLLLLAGSLAGFLVWNRPPAAIFMGDCGSNLIGFLLATLTVAGTFYQRSGSRHVMLAPLCVMAVPLYDFSTVIVIRLLQGRSPFHGDKSHVSHRLVDLGLKPVYAVLTVHLMTAMTGACGLLLYRVTDWSGAAIVMSVIAMALLVVGILEFVGRSSVGQMQGRLRQVQVDPQQTGSDNHA